MISDFQKTKVISIYSAAHAIVDFCCSAVIYSFGGFFDVMLLLKLVIVYNSLAFGLQCIFGFIIDKFDKAQSMAVLGCLLLITGICMYERPMITIIFMGIGNAMFHAGGGSIALKLGNGYSKLPGIFVAPGAIGLFFGTLWWKFNPVENIWLAFLPLIAAAFLLFTDIPKEEQVIYKNKTTTSVYAIIVILLLTAVAIRSFIGLSYDFSGKNSFLLMVLFVLSIALGKMLGGFLADKFGMFNTAVWGLILSVPFLKFGYIPQCAMIGMFLFNLTMPITVTALANMMPKYKGFAFGLTTFALLIGFLPVFTGFKVAQSLFFFEIIIVSAIIAAIALKLYEKLFYRP